MILPYFNNDQQQNDFSKACQSKTGKVREMVVGDKPVGRDLNDDDDGDGYNYGI